MHLEYSSITFSIVYYCITGFDTFKEEVGISKDSMKRGMSLDVQFDEQDLIKVSLVSMFPHYTCQCLLITPINVSALHLSVYPHYTCQYLLITPISLSSLCLSISHHYTCQCLLITPIGLSSLCLSMSLHYTCQCLITDVSLLITCISVSSLHLSVSLCPSVSPRYACQCLLITPVSVS